MGSEQLDCRTYPWLEWNVIDATPIRWGASTLIPTPGPSRRMADCNMSEAPRGKNRHGQYMGVSLHQRGGLNCKIQHPIGEDAEEQCGNRRNHQGGSHAQGKRLHFGTGFAGLVHVHHHQDSQVVECRYSATEQSQDSEPHQVRLQRGFEDVELAKESP